MAFQTPDGFDVFRRTEPSVSLLGKQGTTGFDVFLRTEPALSILQFGSVPPTPTPTGANPIARTDRIRSRRTSW